MGKYDTTTMLTYVRETPAQLARDVEGRRELTASLVDAFMARPWKSVWVIACGSSSNASWCARPFMRKYLGVEVEVVNPGSFMYSEFKPSEDTFCMVISQSGCSTNSIEALDALRAQGRLAIGLTGNLDGDFKDHSDLLVDYGVGEEVVGYVTKGVATLAAFLMLFSLEVAHTQGRIDDATYGAVVADLAAAPALHEETQRRTEAFYQAHHKDLTAIQVNYACGFDQAYGVACEAALKFGETMKVPSFAFEAEEYNHGPNLQVTPNYTAFFIDDMNLGHYRLVQLWRATSLITDRAYLLTADDSIEGTNVFHVPGGQPNEPLVMPLYVLPFFQIVAHCATDELNRWKEHPLFEEFRAAAPSKTETIKKVMPLL